MTGARRYLLIGAGGLVGAALRHALAAEDLVATEHIAHVGGAIPLDVTDRVAVARLIDDIRPGVVIVAAAVAHVEQCEREPLATRAVNVTPVGGIAERLRGSGATLVVFSSEYVFDGSAGSYDEDDPVRPLNEYGRQKVDLERVAATADRYLVCRTSGVFGWEVRRKNFVCQLVDGLRAGREFTVPSDQLITPTYAPSLARAVVDLVRGGHRGIFHVAGPRMVGRVEFARMVSSAFGLREEKLRPRPTRELDLAAARPLGAGLRDSKLRATLGHGLLDPGEALAEMAATEPGRAADYRIRGCQL